MSARGDIVFTRLGYRHVPAFGGAMGKKTKKQNHRARPLPQNVAAIGPQSLNRPDPSVVCPHCLGTFTLPTAALSGWRTVCPHCGMIIVPSDYDERWAEISKDASAASEAVSPILSRCNRIAAKHFKMRFSLVKRWYAWRESGASMRAIGKCWKPGIRRDVNLPQLNVLRIPVTTRALGSS